MGLDDIDEDTPTPSLRKPVVALDDLFGGLGVAQPCRSQKSEVAAAPAKQAPMEGVQKRGSDLDALFSVPVASTAGAACTVSGDLFDFTKPAERKVHTDGASLLDLFDGKVAPRQTTLSEAKTASTSRVTASLLSLMDYYDVLGVDRGASTEEIKRQYKRKALELHPDKVGAAQTPQEAALFKVITKAHEVLTDENRRKEYDDELSRKQSDAVNWLQHLEER